MSRAKTSKVQARSGGPAERSPLRPYTPSTLTFSGLLSRRLLLLLLLLLLLIAHHHQQGHALRASPRVDPDAGNVPGSTQRQQVTNELCLRRTNQLDKCLPKLVVYGDRNFDPPRNDEQLDEHCSMLDENLKCVSSYSRECLPPFARNLYSVVMRRLKTQFAKRCKSKDGRTDFLNLMACAGAKHMEPAHKCMDAFIAHLEHVGSGQQTRQIELTCCTFQLFQDCIFAYSKRMKCSERKVSAEKSIEYVKTIINSMGGDMMEFMCGKYESVPACRSGYPKMMQEFAHVSERVLNGTTKPKSGSPLRPMLQLFIDSQQQTND